jgi:hypothetical protein
LIRPVYALTIIALISLGYVEVGRGQEIIDVIAMGQVGPRDCPIHGWFSALPDFEYMLVITKQDIEVLTLNELRRWIRIYLPRNRKEFVENYDHYIFVDSWLTGWESSPLLTTKQVEDIKWSIGEDGMPVFVTGIWGSDTNMVDGLLASNIEEYYPVDLSKPRKMDSAHYYRVGVNRDPTLPDVLKLFLPLGIEQFSGVWVGQLYPKQGATTWATLKQTNVPNPPPGGWPWLVSWRVGSENTLFWVAADDLEVKWWWGFYNPPTENPYGVDVLANIIYHSMGMPLPEDILLLHELRRRLIEFNDKKALSLSVIEFAEKFKANTGPLWREIATIEEIRLDANEAYLLHEYDEANEILAEAETALSKVGDLAIRLKDNALIWVFIIEWLAVIAASMICGTTLWALMIRRRLYREVKTTRSEVR